MLNMITGKPPFAAVALLSLAATVETAESIGASMWALFSAFTNDGKASTTPKEGEPLDPTTNSVPQNVNQ